MGLKFAEDLSEWRRWQQSRNRLRTLKAAFRRSAPADLVVLRRGDAPSVLFALDAATPSALAAVLAPAKHFDPSSIAVLAPRGVANTIIDQGHLPAAPDGAEPQWVIQSVHPDASLPSEIDSIRLVVAAGHFLVAGAVSYGWANARGLPYCVVQHGLLTPFAPPLPRDATLFAFSEADGEFWCSGRSDVAVQSVGSQMLWDAAAKADAVGEPEAHASSAIRPVFLGQLHGAELPRSVSAATATEFCTQTGASYRPHPAETDRLSRWQHGRWRAKGIEIEDSAKPMPVGRPVAAIFSTGVLEAAAAGVPAWVTCINPPEWVNEFWTRYGLAQWGGDPTPRPHQPGEAPSIAIAKQLQEMGAI